MLDGTAGQGLPVGLGFRPYAATKTTAPWPRCGWVCRTGPGRCPFGSGRAPDSGGDRRSFCQVGGAVQEPDPGGDRRGVVGCATIRWWQSGTIRGCTCTAATLARASRPRASAPAMLSWAEERIRQLVNQHGTARTAVIGANAVASEQDATALLRAAGYRHVFSLVGERAGRSAAGARAGERRRQPGYGQGRSGTSHYRAAWRTVVDSYADRGFTQRWPFQDFVDTADPACWRAAWNGQDMVGVALCSIRRHDHTVGEVEELKCPDGPATPRNRPGPAAGRAAGACASRCNDRSAVHGHGKSAPVLRPLRECGVPAAERVRPLPQAACLIDRPWGCRASPQGFGARQDGWPTTAVT